MKTQIVVVAKEPVPGGVKTRLSPPYSPEQAAMLSDWVWRHVAPSPLDWARNIAEPLRPDDMPEAFARHLAWLLKPMPLNLDRYEAFQTWVEEEILAPLLPANANLIDRLVRMVRADIERLI